MTLVWEHAPCRENALIVLLALADWSNDDGVCWPSIQKLADKARVDRRSAQRIVRRLVHDQLITIEEGGGRAKQHRYKVETAALCRPLENSDFQNSGVAYIERAALETERATFPTQTATPVSPDPLEEPLDDPSIEPSEKIATHKPKNSPLSDDEFFNQLEVNPAYVGIDVRRLNQKMIAWCEVNGKRPTRRRLVNWLNREDRPMENGNGSHKPRYESSTDRNVRNLRENADYIRRLQDSDSSLDCEDPIGLLAANL